MQKFEGTQNERLALYGLVKLFRASDSIMHKTLRHLKESGLTESQFGVLEMLLDLGPLPQAVIAAKHLKTSGNITHIIDNLEKANFVVRESKPNDRRTIIVALAKSGQRVIKEVFQIHVREVTAAFSVLIEKEQKQLGFFM